MSPSDIHKLDYSRFVGLIKERNRPSGGIRSVREVATHAGLGTNSRVLEIGSNTGFTSVNLAMLTGASVLGVDLNAESVEEARRYATSMGVDDRVTFEQGDALALASASELYDLVWVSNVTSFVDDKERLLEQIMDRIRPGGTLAAIPIYYITEPSADLIEEVGEAIGTAITVTTKSQWSKLFESVRGASGDAWERYLDIDYEYDDRSDADIDRYCHELSRAERNPDLDGPQRAALADRFSYFMRLFNHNLRHAGFSVQLYQRRPLRDEEELFTSKIRARS